MDGSSKWCGGESVLTPSEADTIAVALAAARRSVEAAERAAEGARNWLAWVWSGFADATTRQTAQLAQEARAQYDELVAARDRVAASSEPDHEIALWIVQEAKKLSGRDLATEITSTARDASVVHQAAEGAKETADALGLKQLLGVLQKALLALPFILGVVLLIALFWFLPKIQKPKGA